MAEKETWGDRLSRAAAPIAVILVGAYGTWDVVIKPWVKFQPAAEACTTTVTIVSIAKPDPKTGKSGSSVNAPEGLPLVVEAGATRLISAQVDNPEAKPVIYQWKATYGQFRSRVTTGQESIYVAPTQLVNDTITVEARVQGCSLTKRSVAIAVVPSASSPTSDSLAPLPSSSPILPNAPMPNAPTPNTLAPILPVPTPTANPYATPIPPR